MDEQYYLTESELPRYCNVIEGVTMGDVAIATDLINGYLGRSFAPKQFTDRVKLSRNNRGKLSHAPVINIVSAKAITITPFGKSSNPVEADDIDLDPENDGYFTFIGSFGINNIVYQTKPSRLDITYVSGFEEYPTRLKSATGMLASNIRQAMSFNGAKQLTSLDFQVLMTDDSFFTSDIKMLLKGLDSDVRSI